MIFRQAFLDGIRVGTITLAFRRWRRPTVRSGGTLMTAAGRLSIATVAPVRAAEITAADAARAGYSSRDALLAELNERVDGDLYRIELGRLEADPRVALRESVPEGPADIASLMVKLGRLDAAAADGPWTGETLRVLEASPGVRAGDLCKGLGQEKEIFKRNVRKLKALGLTESLDVGYRLSPRGEALVSHLPRRPRAMRALKPR